jgi:hypothetical protein
MARITEKITFTLILFVVFAAVLPKAVFFYIPAGAFENFLGEILILHFMAFLLALSFALKYFVASSTGIVFAAATILFLGFRAIRRYNSDKNPFPPETNILIFLLMLPLHFFLDVSLPLMLMLMLIIAVTIAAQFWMAKVRLFRFIPVGCGILSLAFFDWAESLTLTIFAAICLGLSIFVARKKLSGLTALSASLLLVTLMQIFSAWLPSTFIFRNAFRFNPRLSLSFCESSQLNQVFAVHPQCPLAVFTEKCKDGVIGVYDKATLTYQRDLHLWDDAYHGRPEQIICHKKYFFLGMNEMKQKRVSLGSNAMLVEFRGNEVYSWRNFAGPQIGNSLLYDEMNDALFLTSELDQRIYRWDFQKKQMQTQIGDGLSNPWYWPFSHRTNSGSFISHHDGLSKKQNSGYFSEWVNGRFVHEIDLKSLIAKRRFRINGGGSLGATVDEAENRLWVSHIWGVSVFDLTTGLLVTKHRGGFVNRPVVIDPINNLVFMASTVQGRIYAFDRKTAQPLTTIPLGIGSRYLLVSPETKRLFAASHSGSYAFDLSPESDFVKGLIKHRGGT